LPFDLPKAPKKTEEEKPVQKSKESASTEESSPKMPKTVQKIEKEVAAVTPEVK